jgi:hypothetical protein
MPTGTEKRVERPSGGVAPDTRIEQESSFEAGGRSREAVRPIEAASLRESAPGSATPAPAPVAIVQTKDAYHVKVERILEDNLGDVYLSMPQQTRILFKARGEEAASKLRTMIESAKVKAQTVLHLIREWLKLIPSVNRYFLEQEAKIKTDKIILLAAQKQQEKEGSL